jgi:ABC-type transport system involved in multi-copper enzyme maturation permease subunit
MSSRFARAALWTAAAAVLAHAVLQVWGSLGACPLLTRWMHDLGAGEAQATRLAEALDIGFLLGLLPRLTGLGGRRLPASLLEPLLSGAVTAGASVVAVLALDPLQEALAHPGWLYSVLALGLGFDPLQGAVGQPGWFHALLLLALGVVAAATGGTASRLRILIGVEWLKVRRGRLLRTGLLVAAAATALAAATHAPVANESGWTRAANAMGVGFWTAEILVLVLGATMVAGEMSQGTLKMILPHAYRRAEWIAAKATVLLVCAVIFALVVCVLATGWTAFDGGLGDVTRVAPTGFGSKDKVEVFQHAAVMRAHLAETALAATASLVASALVGLLLSCVFQSLVPALSASFLVFAALKTGDVFLGFSPAVLRAIYAHPPDAMRRLTENLGRALNESWDARWLGRGLRLSLWTSTLGLLASLRLFGRRDLHG